MRSTGKRRLGFLAMALAVVAATAARAAEPLIDIESGSSLFTNVKAHHVGDIVTIKIVEQTTANATSKTDANNKSEIKGGPGLGVLDVLTGWGLNTENKYTGNGRTQRSGSLQTEITARIVEEMLNGDYRLLGTRMVEINNEKQLIEITGICRARDIRADNSILSTHIADARIAYNGRGPINASSDPGMVTKLVNWLF